MRSADGERRVSMTRTHEFIPLGQRIASQCPRLASPHNQLPDIGEASRERHSSERRAGAVPGAAGSESAGVDSRGPSIRFAASSSLKGYLLPSPEATSGASRAMPNGNLLRRRAGTSSATGWPWPPMTTVSPASMISSGRESRASLCAR